MRDRDLMKMKIDEYVRIYGTENTMDTDDIIRLIGAPEKKGIILPSDYCYNSYNNGLKDFAGPHLLEKLDGGLYRVLGSNYLYNGPVYHKPRGERERIVGYWNNGIFSWNKEYEYVDSKPKKEMKQSFNKSAYDTDRFDFKDTLDKEKGVLLLLDKMTNRLVVRKEYETYNRDVFERLKALKLKGMPEIYEIEEKGGKLITLEEYIHGGNLLWIMEQEGCFEESEIVDISLKLCAILSGLHKQNPPLIHRDIKPSNIMLKSGNEVVLIDFNASREYRDGNSQDTVMFGTQYFAAPEQLIGYLQSDERTDVFGLGATMSYLMTKMPAQQIVAPGKLSSVWEKCIEMDKKARYQSVDELAQDILLKWQN